jgi:hypothetical protein
MTESSKKILITLLTSSNIDALKCSYNSVINQTNVKHSYDICIVVNTLNKSYIDVVKETFPQTSIIQTESNGKPGKGHNSLFAIFNHNKKYDYLLPLDGDDFLYPGALSRLEIYMSYNPDVLFLPGGDRISYDYLQKSLHYNIDNKCYLYFNKKSNVKETWLKQKPSPFQYKIFATNTPGRLILCSRHALQLNLNYNEEMKWFDDFNIFLQCFEAIQLNADLKIFMLDDINIHLYNSLNESSATNTFKTQYKENCINEENIFRRSVYNKYLAIRDWDLNKFTFLKCDNTLNYNDKINFATKIVSELNIKMDKDKIHNKSYPFFLEYAKQTNDEELYKVYKTIVKNNTVDKDNGYDSSNNLYNENLNV